LSDQCKFPVIFLHLLWQIFCYMDLKTINCGIFCRLRLVTETGGIMNGSVSSATAAQPARLAQATYEAFIESHRAMTRSAAFPGDRVSSGAQQNGLEQDVTRAASSLPNNVSFESVLSSSLDLEGVVLSRATQLYVTKPGEDPTKPVDSVTTAGGLRVDVTSVLLDAGGRPTASVTVNRSDGQSISFEADDTVRITEREDGSLIVAVAGSRELRVYAADGAVTTEQYDQDGLSDNDGDDIFLLLRSGSLDAGAGDDIVLALMPGVYSINGGDGNDSIIFGNAAIAGSGATIYGGAGNDSVVAHSLHNTLIDLGDGDNSVNVEDMWNSSLALGDGDNSVNVGSIRNSSLDLGDGDNSVNVKSIQNSSLALGDGDNSVNVGSMCNSSLVLGNGDNDITLWNLWKDSIAAESSISVGNGNNTFRWWSLNHGEVSFGDGDNTFIGWSMDQDASLSAGGGNNKFTLAAVSSGAPTVTLGDGDNNVHLGCNCTVNLIRGKGFDANRWGGTDLAALARARRAETAAEIQANNQFMKEWDKDLHERLDNLYA
jgi:hypothetical protein